MKNCIKIPKLYKKTGSDDSDDEALSESVYVKKNDDFKKDVFKRGAMNFEDYNYEPYNKYILIPES